MIFLKRVCKYCGRIFEFNKKCDCYSNRPVTNVDPEKKRFYSSYAWQKLRNRKIKDIGYCERCWSQHRIITTEKLQGHHILSFKHYPECRLDDLNVAVLCQVCNLQIGDTSKVDWTVSDDVQAYVESHSIPPRSIGV